MAQTVLLVEDTDDDAELTIRAFKDAAVAVEFVRARDGVEAMDYLLGNDVRDLPAAVLLDLRMPRLDGLDVLRAVQANDRTKKLPVIVMTSSPDDEDRLQAYDKGALSFVRKPIDHAEFIRAVRTMGLHWSASLSTFGSADR